MMVPVAIVGVAALSCRQSAVALALALGSNHRHPAIVGRPADRPSRTVLASSSRDAEMSSPLSIAILGGGIAGLSCAAHLLRESNGNDNGNDSSSNRNVRITLFDTGRLRPGGRCASRLPGDAPAVAKKRSSGAGDDDNGDARSGGLAGPESVVSSILRQQQRQQQAQSACAASRDRILTTMGPVDHAAQILYLPADIPSLLDESDNDCFHHQLMAWLQDRVVEPFPEGSVCELVSFPMAHDTSTSTSTSTSTTSCTTQLRPIQAQMYYGKGGMASIPIAMRDRCLAYNNNPQRHSSPSFQIMQDVWVSPSNGVKYIGDSHNKNNNHNNNQYQWELRAGHKSLGKYHRLVIAHNGKCADRIMSNTPAKEFHSLLRTKFAPHVPDWGGNEMTLNSIYSLVFAIQCPKPEKNNHGGAVNASHGSPIVNALNNLSHTLNASSSQQAHKDIYTVIIKNEPNLSLLSSNTLKHHHAQNHHSQSNVEVYTLLSSPQFGRQYKGPQENLPLDLMEKVTTEMLRSLENALNIERGVLVQNIVDLKLQLWGAAVPINTWKTGNRGDGFVYDAQYGVGACGDWILDASIAGAWESGRRLAKWILEEQQQQEQQQQQQQQQQRVREGRDVKNWSVGLPNANQSGGKFVPSRAALESGIGTIPSTTLDSSSELPSNSHDDRKASFATRGPFRNAGRGSGSSRRQYSSGNHRGRNNAAANSGGRGRETENRGGKSQPWTR